MNNTTDNEKLNYILDQSRDLFLKYGIRSISMDDIARELGISKKTLYQYVKNKSDLLAKGFKKIQLDFVSSIYEVCSREMNAIDELLEVSKLVNQELKKYNPSSVYDMQKYYPEVFNTHIAEEKEYTYRMILENLEKGIREGIYREDQDIELVANLYIQKVESIHDEKFLSQANITMEGIFEVMFENHIRGISNQKGIEYFEKRKQQLNFE